MTATPDATPEAQGPSAEEMMAEVYSSFVAARTRLNAATDAVVAAKIEDHAAWTAYLESKNQMLAMAGALGVSIHDAEWSQ